MNDLDSLMRFYELGYKWGCRNRFSIHNPSVMKRRDSAWTLHARIRAIILKWYGIDVNLDENFHQPQWDAYCKGWEAGGQAREEWWERMCQRELRDL